MKLAKHAIKYAALAIATYCLATAHIAAAVLVLIVGVIVQDFMPDTK